MSSILSIILASAISLSTNASIDPDTNPTQDHAPDAAVQSTQQAPPFETASDLLTALAKQDQLTQSLEGIIRFTSINALENDRQMRIGDLAIRTNPETDSREYAVSFKKLIIDNRQEIVAEHFIFDGRWFVERLPNEKQFNKRELVPKGQTLDPLELMRDAPFWVSLGKDQDRLLASYDAELLPTSEGLIDNPNFPELKHLAELETIKDTTQIILTPKPGSGFEDDWEWVRIWINPETLHPALYIKAEWTGDLQIVELFSVKANTQIAESVFDTTTPDETSGWNIQLSNWRSSE